MSQTPQQVASRARSARIALEGLWESDPTNMRLVDLTNIIEDLADIVEDLAGRVKDLEADG